mmetsp:Transcript_20235/g.37745  ORF Transcript_20235/g.37745 Transcript_20235/m.37745 type:complete len:699 (-) Transcript_20235:4262-6358(-)
MAKLVTEAEIAQNMPLLLQHASSIDWNVRATACKEVQLMMDQGACIFDSFLESMGVFCNCLVESIEDNRSVLIKEALLTLNKAAISFGPSFEFIAERLIPVLLDQLGAKNKAIQDMICETLDIILEHVRSWRLLPSLLERLSSPHKTVKLKAASMLKHIATSIPMLLSKASRCSATFQRKLAAALKEAQTDKLQEVRQLSKDLQGNQNIPPSVSQAQPEPDAFTLTRVLATRESKKPVVKKRSMSQADDEMQRLLTMSASSVWKTRVRALEEIMKRTDCLDQQQLRFLEAADDCNVKVQEAAMKFFLREAELRPVGLESILTRLMLLMIERQSSLKPSIGQAALYVINQILKHCSPKKVLEAVIRSPIPSKPRAKSEILSIIKATTSKAEANDKLMGVVLNYLAVIHDKPIAALLPETLSVCDELAEKSLSTFIACIYEMDQPKRTKMLKVLKGTDLELKYKQFIGEQAEARVAEPRLPSSEILSLSEKLACKGVPRLEALTSVKALERKLSIEDQSLLLKSLAECMKDESYAIREATMSVLRTISNWGWFRQLTELYALIAGGLNSREDELNELSRSILSDLIGLRGFDDLLQVHLLLLSEASPQEAVHLMRLLSDKLSHVTELPQKMLSILAPLRKLLENSIPEVRKAAIFCVVEAQFILGPKFAPFLESLTPGQMRLVTYYSTRKRQAVQSAVVS